MNFPSVGNINQLKNITNNTDTRITTNNTKISFVNKDTIELTTKTAISKEQATIDSIFGQNGLEKVYNGMVKYLALEHPPKLILSNSVTIGENQVGGGYSFLSNTINYDVSPFYVNQFKLYGIKNGIKTPIIIPGAKALAMGPKELIEKLAQKLSANKAFDEYTVEPATKKDIQKYISQNIFHELLHAKQHEIMRKTEGIGAENIIKNSGINHIDPASVESYKKFQATNYLNSPWVNLKHEENKIKKDSPMGKLAYKFFEAKKNYVSNPASKEYKENLLEKDAYDNSFAFIIKTFGEYN